MKELAPSRNWLNAILGIRSGVAPGFWFDVFAGYKITSSDVLFSQVATSKPDFFSNSVKRYRMSILSSFL